VPSGSATLRSVAEPPAAASIRSGNRRWSLAPGAQLTFGRGQDRDIRLARDPEDDYVSRRAGVLIGLGDGVLIRNSSHTQSLLLQAFPGPELVVAPQSAVATLPHDHLRLVIPGRHGTRYVIVIDTRGMNASRDAGPDPETAPAVPVGRPTKAGAGRITPRELRFLAALCEPVLTLAGPAAAASSYRQIAERLGTTQATAKSCLDQLRARLSDVDGIPGLRSDDDTEDPAHSYLPALAAWAVHSGAVNARTLDLLDPPDDL
jgi:hypothetical protein